MKRSSYRYIAIPVVIALAVIFFILNKNPVLSGGSAGSFEYVRKAEIFLDKGDYRSAIRWLEKAIESSPENRAIIDGLIYAYSKRAEELAGLERFSDAVEYMLKAYRVEQNQRTMQSLALVYAKKALHEARRGDWPQASESLVNARLAAEDSKNASRALGITLYNDAAEECKTGRNASAVFLLKHASLAYEDSHIYALMGDIYYRQSDLERARFYLSKACALDPKNAQLCGNLEKVSGELSLEGAKTVREVAHFRISHEKDLPIDIGFVAGVLEKAYKDVGGDLGYFPESASGVFFYSTKNFREIFKVPDIVRAFYDGNLRLPFPDDAFGKKELASYLFHEYTHAVVSAKTNNNCPAWLNEGLAVWEEMRWTRPEAVINISEDVISALNPSLDTLDRAFAGRPAERPDIALYYILAYTAVDFMVDTWSLAAIRDVLDRISRGQHAVNAIDDEFLIPEKEFEKRWGDFVRKKFQKKEGK